MSGEFTKLRIKAIRKILRLVSNGVIMYASTAVARIIKVIATEEGDFGALDRLSKPPRSRQIRHSFHSLGGCTRRLCAA